jgi:endoglucanase
MKKKIFSLLLTFVFVASFCTVTSAEPEEPSAIITGWEMMEKLGMGINIGNTLDAWSMGSGDRVYTADNHMETETEWGQARVEKWNFEAIAMKGFDHVRIPITWQPHIAPDGVIYKEWMDRVQQIVDWALESDLYVIINTHHERGVPDALYNRSARSFEEAEEWLFNVWSQILDRFEYYPNTLIFEPMNEPYPNGTYGWFWDYERPQFAAAIPVYAARVNQLNQAVLDLIRSRGGNNETRVVIQSPIQASSYLLKYYEPPADDPYIMVGIFCYPNYRLQYIQPALDKGIPVYIKEIAPVFDHNNWSSAPMEEAIAWTTESFGLFFDLGIPTAWWNHWRPGGNDDTWGIFCRHTGRWNKPLIDALFAVYGRTPGADFDYSPVYFFPYEYTGSIPNYTHGWLNWQPPWFILENAEIFTVEYSGTLTADYTFAFWMPPDNWNQFNPDHSRVTKEPGKIIFDICGLETNNVRFMAWGDGDMDKITRLYLTTFELENMTPPFIPCGENCRGEADCEKPCTTGGTTTTPNRRPSGGGGGSPSVPPLAPITPSFEIQQAAGRTTLIVNIPRAVISAINSNIPVTQLKATFAGGAVTVNVGEEYAGQNAVLVWYNPTTAQLEFVTASTVGANGNANINTGRTGDFLVLTFKTGDITGTGAVETSDALALLRHVAGIEPLNSIQQFVANGKSGENNTNDALNILRYVAGVINRI